MLVLKFMLDVELATGQLKFMSSGLYCRLIGDLTELQKPCPWFFNDAALEFCVVCLFNELTLKHILQLIFELLSIRTTVNPAYLIDYVFLYKPGHLTFNLFHVQHTSWSANLHMDFFLLRSVCL